ncbi:MAG TPA: hypothetical protein VKV38_09215 [Trebonia sp.]|jgi:hypothetical protein|nr:hypothetical protein [Trebonia sp.]
MTEVTPAGSGGPGRPGRSGGPGDGAPGDAVPGNGRPGDAVPGDGADGDAVPGDGAPGGPGEDAGLAAERERLARQLRDTRMQLAMTQARLSALEQSATMRFGRMVANAAHRPWPRGALLPRDLYRLWRDRGAPKSGAQNAATALASAQLADLAGTGERFLSALTAPGVLSLADPALTLAGAGAGALAAGNGLVITGALSALGCATLAPDAVVHPLLPHNADVVLEGTGADLVLIEASALLPGAPWAYATDPAAADRGRRLARMIVMARSLGKPVVLVRDVPASRMPGIGWLASSCDAVVDDGLGVQLARFNPIGVTPARPTGPLYAGDRDPREAPAVRALLDSLTSGPQAPVRLAGARSWRGLPALYREHAVFVTASAAQAREQAACGARVIGPIGADGSDADGVRARVEEARAARPLGPGEVRAALRDIFAEHATPARLAALARTAGLPAGLVSGRQVAVLARAAGAAQAGRLAAALLRQRLRPAEVIVATGADGEAGPVRDALAALADHGVRVVTTAAELPAGPDWPRPLARLASAPWLAPWTADGTQPEEYLLDLACARECAQADAVGFGAGEYEFTRWLDEPALARRDLLVPGGPPAADWGGHGLRLFTVTAHPRTRS